MSNDTPVDLRSIYFAWLNKDASAPDYIAFSQKFNEQLSAPGAAGGTVKNLVFAERLDLNSWLGGLQDDSEYIGPLEGAAQAASTDVISPTGDVVAKRARVVDERLLEIYQGERRILDRASVLHGIKPTDFSHVKKHAAMFLGRNKSKTAQSIPVAVTNTALVTNSRKPNRRPEPIILLSPSASSLLRMSNIKKFLEEGQYVPADSTSTEATRLHIMRTMATIDAHRPLRFVLVETPDRFKPEDWSRLVAVFTTGQTWQFKSYKWSTASELFSRVLGIYVGWTAESVPEAVKGWGRTVKVASIDKWSAVRGESGRWRDREVVESIWTAIEESMRSKGWNKENGVR
jgi:parafibromin